MRLPVIKVRNYGVKDYNSTAVDWEIRGLIRLRASISEVTFLHNSLT